MYIYIYVHLHTHINIYIHMCIYIYLYVSIRFLRDLCLSVSLYLSLSLSVCLSIHPSIHLYLHTYILTYLHTYLHTYIHMVGTVSIRIFQDFTIRLIHEDWLQMLSFCSGIAGTMWASSSLVIQYVTVWTFLPVSMFRAHSPSKETVHLPSTLQLIESHGIPQ